MILIGALGLPVMARAQDQDHDRDRVQNHDRDRAQDRDRDRDRDKARLPQSDRDDQGRIYDPYRRDYHNWDANEQNYYNQWARNRHYEGRDYGQLTARQQRQYWQWRHKHDRDRDRDNDRH